MAWTSRSSAHVFPTLIKSWGVSVGGGIAFVVAVGFLAMGLGAVVAGGLSDRWGRKSVLIGSVVVFGGATALGGTSGDFTAFAGWRILACLGMGAAMASGNTLLADLIPERRRAALLATAYAGVGLGTTVGAVLAGTLIPTSGWRVLLVVAGLIPLAVIAVLAVVVPESPAFLSARRRADGAVSPAGRGAGIVRSRFKGSAYFGVRGVGGDHPVPATGPHDRPAVAFRLLLPGHPIADRPVPADLAAASQSPGSTPCRAAPSSVSTDWRVSWEAWCLAPSWPGCHVSWSSGLSSGWLPSCRSWFISCPIRVRFPARRLGDHRLHSAKRLRPHTERPGRHGLPGQHAGCGNRRRGIRRTAGAAAGGVAGGTLIAAGMGLSGLFLVLLLPIGVLLGSLTGLRVQSRRTLVPEQAEVGPTGPVPCGRNSRSARPPWIEALSWLEPDRGSSPVDVESTSTGRVACCWAAR